MLGSLDIPLLSALTFFFSQSYISCIDSRSLILEYGETKVFQMSRGDSLWCLHSLS